VIAAAVAAGVSLGVVLWLERFADRLRLIDRPNDRSSHLLPRPRGGGIGVFAGLLAGLAVAVGIEDLTITTNLAAILAGATIVAIVGLGDDIAPLEPWLRLAVHVAAAAGVVSVTGGWTWLPLPAPFDVPLGPSGMALAVIWIACVTNFFNFMDGADGLAAGQAMLTCMAVALVAWPAPTAMVALVTAGAVAAFLVRNWAPARIFLGDVGSGGIGFLLSALPLLSSEGDRTVLTTLVGTSLALFFVDPIATLYRRWRQGATLTASHREHAYQRLIVPGHSHAPVVGRLLLAAAVITTAALASAFSASLAWLGIGTALALGGAEVWIASRIGSARS
jgi:Fuc2NAc and GlcNAc transferase